MSTKQLQGVTQHMGPKGSTSYPKDKAMDHQAYNYFINLMQWLHAHPAAISEVNQ